MLAHFCCFSSILRLGLFVDCALITSGADGGKGIGRFISLRHIRRLEGFVKNHGSLDARRAIKSGALRSADLPVQTPTKYETVLKRGPFVTTS